MRQVSFHSVGTQGQNYLRETGLEWRANSQKSVSGPPALSSVVVSSKQLLVPAGALDDFFGPGTTVGIPFAAELGVRSTF